ncbi:helix-turn-helix transcriptional regulator [Kitasatospora sp. NPDC051170]|uniref:helix-turn-helix transcriptional regulator n=1 Tax=Kitasatospora sp. NPDC051170 TaxID=3364056 RepID=UPI0037B94A7D
MQQQRVTIDLDPVDDPIRHPLAYAREPRGWSQSDLVVLLDRAARRHGLRSGAGKTAVSRRENRRKQPSLDSQVLIAEAFDVPIADMELFGWPDGLPGREVPRPLGSAYTVAAVPPAGQGLRRARRTLRVVPRPVRRRDRTVDGGQRPRADLVERVRAA